VAVVTCITTRLCLFLGCVLLIRSSFGWFCGRFGPWVACSLQLFCHTFVGCLVSSIQKDGIRNERGLVGLGNTAFEELDFLKPAVILIKTFTRSAREKAMPLQIKFSWIKYSWTRGQSQNSRKYYATKIWSYTVYFLLHCLHCGNQTLNFHP